MERDDEGRSQRRRAVAEGLLLGEGRRREAGDRVQRPADRPHDRRLPDPRAPRLRLRPQPEPHRRPAVRWSLPLSRRGGQPSAPGRADRRARRRRLPLQRARRRGPRRRRPRTARRVRRPSRHVGQLPPPRRAAVHPRQGENGAATLVGYALDGYGIYVVKDANGTLPTNTSLDACHGTTSVVPGTAGRRGSTTTSRRSSTPTPSAATTAPRSASEPVERCEIPQYEGRLDAPKVRQLGFRRVVDQDVYNTGYAADRCDPGRRCWN